MSEVRLSVPARIVALAVAVAVAALVPAAASASDPSVPGTVTGSIIARVDAIRAAHGLGPLTWDAELARAADAHSLDMARDGLFSHSSSTGASFSSRIDRFVRARIVGENLAWMSGVRTGRQAATVVSMWMHSPPHRANLLRPSFHRIGLSREPGGRLGGRRAVVVTADFAS